jgi:hypothetical protein
MGIGDLRRSPIGAKKHADRHVALPERHGLAENPDRKALHILQVGGCGEPVWTGAENYDVTIFHGYCNRIFDLLDGNSDIR